MEQRAADRARVALRARAVHRDVDADVGVGEQPQIAMKPHRIAAMRDRPVAVDPLFVETERHAVERPDAGRLEIVHLLRGFGLHKTRAVTQVRDHEFAHVGAAGRQAACRCRDHHLERLGLLRDVGIALRHMRYETGWQRLAERRVRQVQRLEDTVFDIIVERLAADALDNIPRKCGGIIRISRRRARREDAVGQRERHLLFQRHHRLGIAADQIAHRFLKTRGVRHDVAHRDRLALIGRNLEIEIGVHILVEVDLARLDLLHHRGPGEQLRHRSRAEKRGLGQDRRALGDIGEAVALFEHDLITAHDDDDRAGNARAFERIGQIAVEPGFEILGVERDGRRGGFCNRNRGSFDFLHGGHEHRPLRRQRQRGKSRQPDHRLADETHRFPLFIVAACHILQQAARPLTKGPTSVGPIGT